MDRRVKKRSQSCEGQKTALRLLPQRAFGASDAGQLIEQMSDGFCAIDAAWTILGCNCVHEQVTKIPRAQQIGQDLRHLFLRDQNAEVQAFHQLFENTLATRQRDTKTAFYPTLGLWIECRLFPTADGGLAIFYRDVTKDKQLQAQHLEDKHKFGAIFGNSSAAQAVVRGEELSFEHVNSRYEKLIGGRKTHGKRFTEVFTEFSAEPFRQTLLQVLRSGKSYFEAEQKASFVHRPGGTPQERYVDYVYTGLTDLAGDPYGVHIVVEDVTDRVRARQQLQDGVRARARLHGPL